MTIDADDPRGDGDAARDAAPDAAPRRKKRARRREPGVEDAAVPAAVAVVVPGEVAIDDPAVVAVRRQLLVAAGAAAAGVALVGTGPSDVGMWVAIAGGIGLVASIHRLGRLGPPAVPGGSGNAPVDAPHGAERGV